MQKLLMDNILFVMNEIKIREKLIKELAKQHQYNTEFLAELPIANFSRRIDLVMANGSLSGFEIKSELDTLNRLDGQLKTYTQYFENVTVVCATKHLKSVINITPSNVGILEFDGKQFVSHRESTASKIEKKEWISFLNVIGLKALLKGHKQKVSGLKSELITKAMNLSYDEIRLFILDYLKQQFPIMEQYRQERQDKKLNLTNRIDDPSQNNISEPSIPEAEIIRRERIKRIAQAHHSRMLEIFGDSYEYLP